MSDNTRQFRWIVTIKENLDALLPDFVAGDLLWYPIEGEPKVRVAPDVLIALGRPKGDRGSYKQWEEGGVTPQVVFEILSPGNSMLEMMRKLRFYEARGVSEFYIYDPDHDALEGWSRRGDTLEVIKSIDGWTSPLLGIRFDTSGAELVIYRPDGTPFDTFAELQRRATQAEAARDLAQGERDIALRKQERAMRRAERAMRRAERAMRRAERLRAQLVVAGIEPAEE